MEHEIVFPLEGSTTEDPILIAETYLSMFHWAKMVQEKMRTFHYEDYIKLRESIKYDNAENRIKAMRTCDHAFESLQSLVDSRNLEEDAKVITSFTRKCAVFSSDHYHWRRRQKKVSM